MKLKFYPQFLVAAFVGSLAFFIFYQLVIVFDIRTDIQDHIKVLQTNLEKGGFRINFLYFILIWFVSGFKSATEPLIWASLVVLSLAVAWKAALTFDWIKREVRVKTTLIAVLTISLVLVTNIFFQQHFKVWFKMMGMVSPNVWHNSTVIVLMPLALLLYFQVQRFLINPSSLKIGLVFLLMFLGAGAKPNFLFTLVPSMGLFYLIFKEYRPYFKQFALFIGMALSIIAIQYVLNFIIQVNDVNGGENKLSFKPFHVINHYTGNLPLSLAYSFLFPFSVTIFYFKSLIKSKEWLFIMFNLIIGLTIGFVMSEGGAYEFDNNLSWQNVVNQYLLFCFLIIWLLKQPLTMKNKICYSLFSVHVLFGIYYIIKTLQDGFYL